jgi:DNA-binding FrmR family transcriptional regulator
MIKKENLVSRLNRIKGQIDGIIRLVEEDSDCEVVFQQMKAAYSAMRSAIKYLLIEETGICIEKGNEKKLKRLLEKLIDLPDE